MWVSSVWVWACGVCVFRWVGVVRMHDAARCVCKIIENEGFLIFDEILKSDCAGEPASKRSDREHSQGVKRA